MTERWIQLSPGLLNNGLRGKGGKAIDPSGLPISDELRERLAAWCARLWDTLEDEAFTDIARTAVGRERAWTLIGSLDKDGLAIARALKAELPDWTVYYYDAATVAASHFGKPASELGVLVENS